MASWLYVPDRAVRVRGLAADNCVMFLGKTLASLHPGLSKRTDEFNAGGNPTID